MRKALLFIALLTLNGGASAKTPCLADDPVGLVKLAWQQPNHRFETKPTHKNVHLISESLRAFEPATIAAKGLRGAKSA